MTPIFGFPFFVRTKEVTRIIDHSNKSGAIYQSYGDRNLTKLRENLKLNALLKHWEGGVSWEESGVYELMLERIMFENGSYKGLVNHADILSYYDRMDDFYQEVLKFGLKVPPRISFFDSFFALNGITFEIGQDGEVFFAGRGSHRLAMSIAAKQTWTPGYIVGVRREALLSGVWRKNLLTIQRGL